ncbi:uncharacterized protein LOC144613242 isoform X4 [Panthera onca]
MCEMDQFGRDYLLIYRSNVEARRLGIPGMWTTNDRNISRGHVDNLAGHRARLKLTKPDGLSSRPVQPPVSSKLGQVHLTPPLKTSRCFIKGLYVGGLSTELDCELSSRES